MFNIYTAEIVVFVLATGFTAGFLVAMAWMVSS